MGVVTRISPKQPSRGYSQHEEIVLPPPRVPNLLNFRESVKYRLLVWSVLVIILEALNEHPRVDPSEWATKLDKRGFRSESMKRGKMHDYSPKVKGSQLGP